MTTGVERDPLRRYLGDDVADAFNELAAASGLCIAYCEHGGSCTLDHGHDGDHIAHGSADNVLCQWPNPEPDR